MRRRASLVSPSLQRRPAGRALSWSFAALVGATSSVAAAQTAEPPPPTTPPPTTAPPTTTTTTTTTTTAPAGTPPTAAGQATTPDLLPWNEAGKGEDGQKPVKGEKAPNQPSIQGETSLPTAKPSKPGDAGDDDQKNWFRPFAQLSVDLVAAAGSHVNDYLRTDGGSLAPGAVISLSRLGARGTVHKKWMWEIFSELGVSNSRGAFQSLTFSGGFNNAWIGYRFGRAAELRVGHMYQPFGSENMRIPDFWDFSRPARTTFLTSNGLRDTGILLTGSIGPAFYGVGIYNGEGRAVAPVDTSFAGFGRVGVRVNEQGDTRARIGISGSYGGVDPKNSTALPFPASLTTSQGYAFWDGSYSVSGPVAQNVRVLRAGSERQLGADAMVQFGSRFDLSFEGAYVDLGRRESSVSALDEDETLRSGSMYGVNYFVTANYWLTDASWQKQVRFYAVTDPESREGLTQTDFSPAIGLRARWEHNLLHYDSISRSPAGTLRGAIDWYTTRLEAETMQAAVVCWFTRRIMLMAQYGLDYFPADYVDAPVTRSPTSIPIAGRRLNNQAIAPGAVVQGERGTRGPSNLPVDVNVGDPQWFKAPDLTARFLHEFTLRAFVTFP